MFSFQGMSKIPLDNPVELWYYINVVSIGNCIVGIDCDEGPPVPIPNTEVKLVCAENTLRETAREDR